MIISFKKVLIFFLSIKFSFCVAMEITAANNNFGLDLFQLIFKQNPTENSFISPFSISVALAMTQLGARGATATEMSSTLKWPKGKDEAMHKKFQSYMQILLNSSVPYQLSSVNRLFIQKNFSILENFLNQAKEFYLAAPESSDFVGAAESERKKINAWVSEQTNNKIEDLLAPGIIDGLTRMVLVNAVYFKGDWEKPFKKEATRPHPFKISESVTRDVPMMFIKQKFPYLKDDGLACTLVEIPYSGKDLGMVIILPDDDFGLQKLVENLTNEKLSDLLSQLGDHRPEVELRLPRFELTSSFNLKEMLVKLGMSSAFDDNSADFSGMTKERELKISEVVHKAFVKVNEEGTEAAAATAAVMMMRCAMIPMDPLEVTVDHPFLVLLRDQRAEGIFLFVGHVTDLPQFDPESGSTKVKANTEL